MDEERKDAAKIHVIYLLKQRLLSEDRFFTILLLVVAFRRGEQILVSFVRDHPAKFYC